MAFYNPGNLDLLAEAFKMTKLRGMGNYIKEVATNAFVDVRIGPTYAMISVHFRGFSQSQTTVRSNDDFTTEIERIQNIYRHHTGFIGFDCNACSPVK